ncbi:MAG: transporter substrate-binding domain-containing protein [Clostridia bacterium]|nr:transporter substrate-binding domain-containing protein [Clostridia bacterium]
MKKLISLMLAAALLLTAVCALAEGESDKAYVLGKGKLVVGITDFEPIDYRGEDGEWIGFDADMARAFAAWLGVEVEFAEINWDNKVFELNGRTIDCVWNGMTLNAEVMAAMATSNPYADNAQVVVVPADKAADYQTVESIAGLTFAVEAGSAGEEQISLLGYAANPVESQAMALLEVAGLTSDAAVIDLLMASAMVGEGTDYANLAYTVSLNSEQYGVGFRLGSDLVDDLNAFFAEAWADGTMKEIAARYNIVDVVVPQE